MGRITKKNFFFFLGRGTLMGEDLVIFWLIGIAPPNGLGAEKKNERKTKKSAN